ncbi:DUF732 domain-containing protein, partial [Streptosporangium algeriense]
LLVAAGGAVYLLNRNSGTSVALVTQTPETPRPSESPLSTDPTDEPSPDDTGEVEPTPEPTASSSYSFSQSEKEDLFLKTVRQRKELSGVTSTRLVRLGKDVCGALDTGKSLIQVTLDSPVTDEFGAETSGYIAGAAVVLLCPEHRAKLPK